MEKTTIPIVWDIFEYKTIGFENLINVLVNFFPLHLNT